jgi:LmbE family N-acetylglucosaminyl deacetylase
VVAPHPDDESVGPGGTLAWHARAGDEVAALFVTNGMHGDVEKRLAPEAYVALRREEAGRAAAALGLAGTIFWDFPDDCVVTRADLDHVAHRLGELFEQQRPDVIYAPHVGECHSDHHFVALATEQAWRAAGSRGHLLGYEVWSPVGEPDLVVDVSDTWEAKVAAVGCYPSQLAHTDILGAIEGLNRYRAILLGPGGADGRRRAEAFQEVA